MATLPPSRRARTPAPLALTSLAVALLALTPASHGLAQSGAQSGGQSGPPGDASNEGQLCQRAGDARHPEARTRLQALAAAGGATGAFAQGCLHLADDRFGPAADAFERAVRERDGSAVYHFWLGQAYGAQAQRANVLRQASLAGKTKREFERAVQLAPDYVEAREGLMQYYLLAPGIMGGSKERARQQLAEIRRRNAYRGALLAAGLALREKDTAGAVREYEQLTRQYPDSVSAWSGLAQLQGQQGQWDAAWATVDRMLRATDGAPAAQYTVGRIAAESGQQLERGAAALAGYLRGSPRPGEPSLGGAHWRLGMIREKQGQRAAARAEYEAALRLEPKLDGARKGLERVR